MELLIHLSVYCMTEGRELMTKIAAGILAADVKYKW